MQVLILAAGYGTRLYPLTLNVPKPLLPCNGKPIINFLLDKVRGFRDLKNVIVITNNKFTTHFADWAKENKNFPVPLYVLSDGTNTPDDRLGAMGDIRFVLEKNLVNDDLLVMGGDNLFDYSLDEYKKAAQNNKPHATIGLYDIHDKEAATKFGIVELDKTSRVVSFEEKPQKPKSTLTAMCLYYFPKESLSLISTFLKETEKVDRTGDYIEWLSKNHTVFGFTFVGRWFDIGSMESYKEAEKIFKP